MDSLNTITFWISNIAGVLSVLTILIWIISIPSSDKRFRTGYKDNAEAPGCGMPIFAIITGLIAYYISEDGYFYIFFSALLEAFFKEGWFCVADNSCLIPPLYDK